MEEQIKRQYLSLLNSKIREMFGLNESDTDYIIKHSAIEKMIDEMPEYIDTTPLEEWASLIYAMFYDETLLRQLLE